MQLDTFLAFWKEATKMEASQYREQLDIVMAPKLHLDYYKTLRARYNRLIIQSPRKRPEPPPSGYVDAGSEQAKDLMFSVFRALKRSHGYGG